jgi:hypothetical protein
MKKEKKNRADHSIVKRHFMKAFACSREPITINDRFLNRLFSGPQDKQSFSQDLGCETLKRGREREKEQKKN